MKDFFLKNTGLKLLSLVFAVSLWLFVNLKATTERDLQLPVRWVNLPNFLEITNPVNDFVRIRVTGPRRILSHLNPTRFPVILDLADAKVGLMDYQISDKMISLIPGLKATVLPPDIIQFKFDIIVAKEVLVKPRIVGKPPKGYTLKSIEVNPDRIEIVGAQSEVQGINAVETEVVNVQDLRENIQKDVKVVLNWPHVWPSTDQGHVSVRIVIGEKNIQKIFRRVLIQVKGTSRAVMVQPPRVDVVLDGPAGKLQSILPENVEVSVHLPEGVDGPYTLPVTVRVDREGISAACLPAKVVVTNKAPNDPT